jgi:UDP-3-O-acyl-N-acetylglucosamine deacetylase
LIFSKILHLYTKLNAKEIEDLVINVEGTEIWIEKKYSILI